MRYSAAKYLARIAALLPSLYSTQIVSTCLDLFGGIQDDPHVETSFGTVLDPGGNPPGGTMGFGSAETTRGEARWHGCCLAVAELARRGLIGPEHIADAVMWALKVRRCSRPSLTPGPHL